MLNGIFILIMVVGGTSSQSGLTAISAEFNNQDACNRARTALEKMHSTDKNVPVRMQGCFAKN